MINWTKGALKQLLKIQAADRSRIVAAVGGLRSLDGARHVMTLTGHQYGYRLRVGDYRVLFDVDDVVRVIEIQKVARRNDNTY